MDTRSSFHKSIEELEYDVIKMATLVEEMIFQAVKSLAEMNVPLAEKAVLQDDEVDKQMLLIEGRCMRLIALQQPMATDLRMIGTALKIVTDLERVADHAVDIAKVTKRLAGEKLVKPLIDVPKIAEMVMEMLHTSITAFVKKDAALCETLADKDDEVDKLYASIFDELIELMGTDKTVNRQLSHLLMVAHSLERVGDHATNIGEWVIYMVSGNRKDLNL